MGAQPRIRKSPVIIAIASAALVSMTLAGCNTGGTSPTSETSFYEGKTIEILVPAAPGGGTDTEARFFAPFLAEFLPGNPRVGIFNDNGAGGIVGGNLYANNRDPEKATSFLYSSASHLLPWIFQDPGLELDYSSLAPLMVSPTGAIAYVHSSTGITGPEDFVQAVKDGAIKWTSGEGVPNGTGLMASLAFDLLGMEPNVVFGFDGRGPARVAFQQQELNVNWDVSPTLVGDVDPLIEQGVAVPVFIFGKSFGGEIIDDPILAEKYPDLPNLAEMYAMIHDEQPEGELWDALVDLMVPSLTSIKVMWLHGDAPEEAIAEVRQAFVDMSKSAKFKTAVQELMGDYGIVVGDDVEPVVDRLLNFSTETGDLLIDYMVENFDYRDPR